MPGGSKGADATKTLLELPNGYALHPVDGASGDLDFAVAVVRNFLFSSFQALQWQRLSSSADDELSAIAMKSLKETRYHEDHAAQWLVRLGDGSDDSHRRVDRALHALWPYTGEMFAADDVDRAMAEAGIGVDPSTLEAMWREGVVAVLQRATFEEPKSSAMRTAGKLGTHSEHLGFLLAEMQFLQRAYPGGAW